MNPEELSRKLEPVLGRKAVRLYQAWLLGDRKEKEEIEQCLQFLYYKHFQASTANQPILFHPPARDVCNGEIHLGEVCYNNRLLYPFGLHAGELAQHLAIFGRSGSGKTNTVRLLLKGLLKQKIPFLLFDWKKDYSQLDFEAVFDGMRIGQQDIRVLPLGKRNVQGLRLNPLIPPPGTAAETWAKQLCEILTHAYMGGPGFESLFLKALDHCYSESGIYQGSNTYPTFQDLKAYFESLRCTAREAQWLQSVMRTVNGLCFGEMNQVVNAPEPMAVISLLDQNTILELDAVSNADKTFLIETILLWLRHYRLSHPPKKKLENVLIIEEAHHLLRQMPGEESLVETSLREMRSLGIGLVIVDQMPSLISKIGLANTFCTIALNVKTGADVHALSQAMLLSTDEKDILGQLPVGQALVKLQDRFLRPFHIRIPLVPTGNQRILHYQEDPNTDSRIPRKIFHTEGKTAVFPPPIDTSAEDELLIDILKHPTDSVTQRYKRLDYSARKGNYAKDKLIEKDFIRPITLAGLNVWLRLFELTDAGKDHLKTLGAFHYSKRYGGLAHLYWQERLEEHYLSLGYTVEREKRINGHNVDLVASKENERIAIEVETGRSNFTENIRQCLKERSFTSIVIACISQAVAERISKEMKGVKDARLSFTEVRKLLTQ